MFRGFYSSLALGIAPARNTASWANRHFQSICESYFSVSHCTHDTDWRLSQNSPCREPAECTVSLPCAPPPCHSLCPFRRKLSRGGKEQMELWLCLTELWPGKLAAYRKQENVSSSRQKATENQGRGKKHPLSFPSQLQKAARHEVFKPSLLKTNVGSLLLALVWLNLSTSERGTQAEASQDTL